MDNDERQGNPPSPPRPETDLNKVIELVAQAATEGRLLLFVGTGFSRAVLNWKNNPEKQVPSWLDLLERLCDINELDAQTFFCRAVRKHIYDCPAIATAMVEQMPGGKANYQKTLSKLKSDAGKLSCWIPLKAQCKNVGNILWGIHPSVITTTNYDEVLEAILGADCKSIPRKGKFRMLKGNSIPVWHVHGDVRDTTNIVLSREDYLEFFRPGNPQQKKLAKLLRDHFTLFVGYSLSDLNLLAALDWATNFKPSSHASIPYASIGNDASLYFLAGPSEGRDLRQIVLLFDKHTSVPNLESDPLHPTCGIVRTSDTIDLLSSIADVVAARRNDHDRKSPEESTVIRIPKGTKRLINRKWVSRFLNDDERENLLKELAEKLESGNRLGFQTRVSASIIETLKCAYARIKRKAASNASIKWGCSKYSHHLSFQVLLQVIAHMPIKRLPVRNRVCLFDELERRSKRIVESELPPLGDGFWKAGAMIPTERRHWIQEVAAYLGNLNTIQMMKIIAQKRI